MIARRREKMRALMEDGTMRCLDYGLSFICHTARANAVRFWVESRTRIVDDRNGGSTDFYQCASCKSENTFGEKDLFYADNYDFLPIIGGGRCLIFRRKARLNADDVRAGFADFDRLGDNLTPREQAKIIALLVARIELEPIVTLSL
ncbi:MAG: hypothetical protein N2689_16110, partial [Verrucomicrobiae bacterium]|nr:hypothetical protein [Verrucomicrobiae bacterium]